MKELILKKTLTYILILGKASKLVLYFFDPKDNEKASWAAFAALACAAHVVLRSLFLSAPDLTDALASSPIQSRKWPQGISLFC